MIKHWFKFGLSIKRWLIIIMVGVVLISLGFAALIIEFVPAVSFNIPILLVLAFIVVGVVLVVFGHGQLTRSLVTPYLPQTTQTIPLVQAVQNHQRRRKGVKFVAIGGGTGLPSVLRAMKPYTDNIAAVVTVADDGGSSGRLRREMGVLPPGDLRNNIVALADDENIMARLFQYRFTEGDMQGHAFGNLFIAALAGVTGSIEKALIETARVLNIQGQVLPSTLENVTLTADVRLPQKRSVIRVQGESKIAELGGQIETLELHPHGVQAYDESVRAILEADLIVIGPGSLYTSILPNLLVDGIREALRATQAYKIYLCNVATQRGETEGFNVADHVLAMEQYIGRGVFQAVLANKHMPIENAGVNTRYVQPVSAHHEIAQRYEVRYFDLTDDERPWRHSPQKIAQAILSMRQTEGIGGKQPSLVFN